MKLHRLLSDSFDIFPSTDWSSFKTSHEYHYYGSSAGKVWEFDSTSNLHKHITWVNTVLTVVIESLFI